ncbi:MAG TPA: family 16 glycoside hydrolase [Candidatus Limnocylindria bacterium]|nr:family 16 glycoside hydrolase [Candidatus Limnocylindria bacterium]
MKWIFPPVAIAAFVLTEATLSAAVITTIGRLENSESSARFHFDNVPAPAKGDAGEKGKFTVVDGVVDSNGGEPGVLNDGALPRGEDQPRRNFFFAPNSDGGRLQLDLVSPVDIRQINSYSWHNEARGPQVYKLYASDGSAAGFEATPKRDKDPEKSGWTLVAKVDTRPAKGELGGQYGVSLSDSSGTIGKYRYLLFDIERTETTDGFGNTFFSEIDIIDGSGAQPINTPVNALAIKTIEAGGGQYQISLDTSEAPDLTDWVVKELAPVVQEWYPKVVDYLPSEGFTAPKRVSIVFTPEYEGVAATGGNRIQCAPRWFRQNLQGEAKGAVVHELVHVVQQYGLARRNNPQAARNPGWLVEGLADYVRWFRYETNSHGAEVTAGNIGRVRYNSSYRPTANFLNWVSVTYKSNLVQTLNAAMRQGKYSGDLWTAATGKTVEDLGDEWRQAAATKLGVKLGGSEVDLGQLPAAEREAGWKPLFNGRDFSGWHNFKSEGVKPGWKVTDGALVCADPHNAGDLCTNERYDWFELQLDYNITPAGNSGIMFHVTDDGGAAWATGPEFQLEDNKEAKDAQRCGWLYALYQPPVDPKTGQILDATKPAGQWNHVRLLITPEKCEHEINGVKYFEYTLGSDDFRQRVAKSKFNSMPLFAKFDKGYIALQGDHGSIWFKNIKIRPIQAKK